MILFWLAPRLHCSTGVFVCCFIECGPRVSGDPAEGDVDVLFPSESLDLLEDGAEDVLSTLLSGSGQCFEGRLTVCQNGVCPSLSCRVGVHAVADQRHRLVDGDQLRGVCIQVVFRPDGLADRERPVDDRDPNPVVAGRAVRTAV